MRPPFRLAKFEGDAAFLYAVGDKADGSAVQDAIEATYSAFRRRLRDIKQATSCECTACQHMQQLDLKFVVHPGELVTHKMAGRSELAGRDVILVHRLLKNGVNDRLGGHAYVLHTDACLQALGGDGAAQGLVEHADVMIDGRDGRTEGSQTRREGREAQILAPPVALVSAGSRPGRSESQPAPRDPRAW
ncbi:MAG: DUF2652 domain-containing protein [Chloroflexota bacterium]